MVPNTQITMLGERRTGKTSMLKKLRGWAVDGSEMPNLSSNSIKVDAVFNGEKVILPINDLPGFVPIRGYTPTEKLMQNSAAFILVVDNIQTHNVAVTASWYLDMLC